MRTRASFAFAGVLVIALIAVLGFAAFSTQDTAQPADDPAADLALRALMPATARGRVLGAVAAAALMPEPTIDDVATTGATEPPAETILAAPAETTTTTSPPTTTTTKAPDPKPSTATVAPPDTSAPEITITFPGDGAVVTDRVIEFTGQTEPGALVTSGNYSAEVDEEGNWSIVLVLLEGGNRAFFTASDEAGNEETAQVTVVYDPPATTSAPTTAAPTTTTTTEPPVDGGPRNVEEWRALVEQYFLEELVEEALVVMKCESRGDPLAYNARSAASGLFQFIPNTWNWASQNAGWAGATAFDPEANVASAAWLTEWSIGRGKDAWSQWSCKP